MAQRGFSLFECMLSSALSCLLVVILARALATNTLATRSYVSTLTLNQAQRHLSQKLPLMMLGVLPEQALWISDNEQRLIIKARANRDCRGHFMDESKALVTVINVLFVANETLRCKGFSVSEWSLATNDLDNHLSGAVAIANQVTDLEVVPFNSCGSDLLSAAINDCTVSGVQVAMTLYAPDKLGGRSYSDKSLTQFAHQGIAANRMNLILPLKAEDNAFN